MKKLLIIVLLGFICILAISNSIVSAKANWNKWDQELPSADNKAWCWAVKTNKPSTLNLKDFNVTLLFSDTYFFDMESKKIKASVFFYSSDVGVKKYNISEWDIPDASLALAAFPPKKGRMIIRAYKMEKNKFLFLEKWEIAFKEKETVVPKDVKFRKEFEEWIKSQISSKITISQLENLNNLILPKLVIINKNTFMITNMISD